MNESLFSETKGEWDARLDGMSVEELLELYRRIATDEERAALDG